MARALSSRDSRYKMNRAPADVQNTDTRRFEEKELFFMTKFNDSTPRTDPVGQAAKKYFFIRNPRILLSTSLLWLPCMFLFR